MVSPVGHSPKCENGEDCGHDKGIRCQGHGTQIEFRCIGWLLRAGGVFRVDLESGSGSTVQGRYEGRLTTARKGNSTVWIERSGHISECIESVSEVDKRNGWLRDIKWEAGTVRQGAMDS